MRITNPKVATLAPTWRRYRGVSVLFDNPGTLLGPGVVPLADTAVHGGAQRLYDVLAEVVAQVDAEEMRGRYGFCPLPRPTYHVTVCDGPNERDIPDLPRTYGVALRSVLDELPDVDRLPADLDFLDGAGVRAALRENPVTFRATDVVVWGHVLAAVLEPAGAAARDALDRVAPARERLADEVRASTGLTVPRWRPHVSLGYFPNREVADAATATLPRWRESLAADPEAAITFASAAGYGFYDMVSYFRLGG